MFDHNLGLQQSPAPQFYIFRFLFPPNFTKSSARPIYNTGMPPPHSAVGTTEGELRMNLYSFKDDLSGERLLFVNMERSTDAYSGAYAHIRATVVRRAVPDVVEPFTSTWIWEDGANSVGYRNAHWSGTGRRAVYVDGLVLRGQINVHSQSAHTLDGGRPYGNELEFRAMYLRKPEQAQAIADTLTKYQKYRDDCYQKGTRAPDEFYERVCEFGNFLKIKKFLFARNSTSSECWLSRPEDFYETYFAGAKVAIEGLLAPYAV